MQKSLYIIHEIKLCINDQGKWHFKLMCKFRDKPESKTLVMAYKSLEAYRTVGAAAENATVHIHVNPSEYAYQ